MTRRHPFVSNRTTYESTYDRLSLRDRPAPVIPFLRPELPPAAEVERYFAVSRRSRRFANGGPCHGLLAERLAALLGGPVVVPVSSGATGLIVALSATTERDPGRREVLLPSFTFAACAASVVWAGLVPVFCDVEEDGWHLCPDALERAVLARGDRLAAILACWSFGTPPPPGQAAAWRRAADAAGVPLIIDAAAGLAPGIEADVAVADAVVFSMHATKPMPVGEGGVVALRDPAAAELVGVLVNHGLDAEQNAVVVGLNGKLDEWHAATALAGLDRLASTLSRRRALAAGMRVALEPSGAVFQRGAKRSPTQFIPSLLPSAAERRAVLAAAAAARVELRTYFSPPLHVMPAYRACRRADELTVTSQLAERIVSLPMADAMSARDRDRIVDCVGTAAPVV